jgi:hypothetical protein
LKTEKEKIMSLYKVTTEADCEGSRTKLLGYVEARSPEHAVKYLKHKGIDEYYKYRVIGVTNLIHTACSESELTHLVVTKEGGYSDGTRCFTVDYDRVLLERKREEIQQKLDTTGLTKAQLIAFLEGK